MRYRLNRGVAVLSVVVMLTIGSVNAMASEFEGLFGIKLGDNIRDYKTLGGKLVPGHITKFYLEFISKIEPKQKNNVFADYQVRIRPKLGTIYMIDAYSPPVSHAQCIYLMAQVAEILVDKYGGGTYYDEDNFAMFNLNLAGKEFGGELQMICSPLRGSNLRKLAIWTFDKAETTAHAKVYINESGVNDNGL